MKIITLHQPWASLVAFGLKKYETRHWSTDYRGPLLTHAAKKKIDSDGIRVWREAHRLAGIEQPEIDALDLPLGCVVAIAYLVNCLEMYQGSFPFIGAHASNSIRIDQQSDLERAVGYWELGRFALQLDNARQTEPIPFTSRQGKLLDTPPEIIDKVYTFLRSNKKQLHTP